MGQAKSSRSRSATAFAPATVANVAVGFDVLGFAVDGVGDRVTVAVDAGLTGVEFESISGVVPDLPSDPARNTASVALLALIEGKRPGHGFRISLEKGIPLGSGMGGSAASAVGAVVAANHLLDEPLSMTEMLRYSMAGEQVASGSAHADNAAPCLHGGMTAVVAHDPPEVISIPVPPDVVNVLVHPHFEIETRLARAALPAEIPMSGHVDQSMRLAGFLAGCFRGDLERIRGSMVDLLVEPFRASMIPGFDRARDAARAEGALGFGIAGAGPSVFAWTSSDEVAARVASGVERAFESAGLTADRWIGPIRRDGAAVVSSAP